MVRDIICTGRLDGQPGMRPAWSIRGCRIARFVWRMVVVGANTAVVEIVLGANLIGSLSSMFRVYW